MSGYYTIGGPWRPRVFSFQAERALPSGGLAVDTVEIQVSCVVVSDKFEPEIRVRSEVLKTELFEPRRWGPFSWWTKVEETKAPSGAGEKET